MQSSCFHIIFNLPIPLVLKMAFDPPNEFEELVAWILSIQNDEGVKPYIFE